MVGFGIGRRPNIFGEFGMESEVSSESVRIWLEIQRRARHVDDLVWN